MGDVRPVNGGGVVVVGTVFAAFDLVAGPPPIDLVRLAGQLWNVELTRDSTLRPKNLVVRLGGTASGAAWTQPQPPEAKRGRPEVPTSALEPASATVFANGTVQLVTAHSVGHAEVHAAQLAHAVRRAAQACGDSDAECARIGVHRFRVGAVNAYFHALAPRSQQAYPVSKPNSIRTQDLHSQFTEHCNFPDLDARVDVLSDPQDRTVRLSVVLGAQSTTRREMGVTVEHTGVATVRRITSLDDFEFAAEHILGAAIRTCRRVG